MTEEEIYAPTLVLLSSSQQISDRELESLVSWILSPIQEDIILWGEDLDLGLNFETE